MAPKQHPILLPPNLTLEKLVPVQQLLHLTVHRNKNQHRITKWWGNLQLLRRNVKRLIEMLQSPKAEYRKSKEALLRLANWTGAEIIPRVYLSFSAVVADNQYASLGLMLMGCLARVNACVTFPRSRLQSEVAEVEATMKSTKTVIPSEDFGEAITRGEEKLEEEIVEETRMRKKMKEKRRKDMLDGDLGVSISRDASDADSKPKKREVLDIEGSSEEEERKPKKVKKTKKVSRKFVEEFDHLSGNSSSEEEPVPKKAKKFPEARPTEKETSGSEDEIKPPPTKTKKLASTSKTSKQLKKKKKKGGDDFDDLFADIM